MRPGFAFLDQSYYDQLETVPWLDKDGREAAEEALKELPSVAHSETPSVARSGAQPSQLLSQVRILKSSETLDVSKYPATRTEVTIDRTRRVNETERLALAKIAKADSPFLPSVVRDDQPGLQKSPASKIIVLCADSLNAGEQEGALEMIKAIKLVNGLLLHFGPEPSSEDAFGDGCLQKTHGGGSSKGHSSQN